MLDDLKITVILGQGHQHTYTVFMNTNSLSRSWTVGSGVQISATKGSFYLNSTHVHKRKPCCVLDIQAVCPSENNRSQWHCTLLKNSKGV